MLDFRLLFKYLERQKEFYEYLEQRSKGVGIGIDYYDKKLGALMIKDFTDIIKGCYPDRPYADDTCTFFGSEDGEALCAVTNCKDEFMPCLQPYGTCAWYRQSPVVFGPEMDEYVAYRKKTREEIERRI